MYCRKCGNKNNDGALFCSKCGTPIKLSSSLNDNIINTPNRLDNKKNVIPNMHKTQMKGLSTRYNKANLGKQNGKGIIIGGISLIVIIALVIIIFTNSTILLIGDKRKAYNRLDSFYRAVASNDYDSMYEISELSQETGVVKNAIDGFVSNKIGYNGKVSSDIVKSIGLILGDNDGFKINKFKLNSVSEDSAREGVINFKITMNITGKYKNKDYVSSDIGINAVMKKINNQWYVEKIN